MTAEVKKVEPLSCPQCRSLRVKAGFTRKKGRAFLRDGKIWCYDCKQVTDTKTGKVKKHEYDPLKLEET